MGTYTAAGRSRLKLDEQVAQDADFWTYCIPVTLYNALRNRSRVKVRRCTEHPATGMLPTCPAHMAYLLCMQPLFLPRTVSYRRPCSNARIDSRCGLCVCLLCLECIELFVLCTPPVQTTMDHMVGVMLMYCLVIMSSYTACSMKQ